MTDFDATNEGAPTEPLPIADGTAPTAPLLPSAPVDATTQPAPPIPPVPAAPIGATSEAPAVAQTVAGERRPWRPSTGGMVALAVAGGLIVSTVSFGAGWGTRGLVSRFHQTHGFASRQGHDSYSTQDGSGPFGNMPNGTGGSQSPNGNGSQTPDSDSRQGPNDGSGYGGCGMGQRGGWGEQSAPQGMPTPNQQGMQQDGAQESYACPGMSW